MYKNSSSEDGIFSAVTANGGFGVFIFCVFSFSFLTLIIFAFLSNSYAFADNNSVVDRINITVSSSCNIYTEDVDNVYNQTMHNSEYVNNIGSTTIQVHCNDNNGYAVYAVGYSNEELGNTYMIHDSDATNNFNTGLTIPVSHNMMMRLTLLR